jgi:hypothetical protein
MTDQEFFQQKFHQLKGQIDTLNHSLSTIANVMSEEWEYKKEVYGIDEKSKERKRISHERNLEILRKFKAEEEIRKANQTLKNEN